MLDSYFKISERGSTLGREVRGGFVTFFTMAYIVALNPLIIGLSKDAEGKFLGGGDAPNLAAIAAMTALIAGILTILMGVVGNSQHICCSWYCFTDDVGRCNGPCCS